jgi:hypothetical protein
VYTVGIGEILVGAVGITEEFGIARFVADAVGIDEILVVF